MKCRIPLFVLFVVLYAHAQKTPAPDGSGSIDSRVLRGIGIFQNGYDQWSRDSFFKAHEIFTDVVGKAPDSVVGYYWKGVTEFYLVTQALYSTDTYKDPDVAEKYLDQGIETFEKALEISESCAECHALLGTLYGIAIAENPFRAVTLGPRVQNHMEKALSLDSDNPRIHYLAGMSYLFTPGFLGGGKDKAIDYLQKSESLYNREQNQTLPPTAPRWGHSTALAFLGRAHEAKGSNQKAVEYFKKALKVNAQDLIARDGLKRLGDEEPPVTR
ncbi:MAG: tetratricopeptide repeat protein [Chitinivibrionales bacterium]